MSAHARSANLAAIGGVFSGAVVLRLFFVLMVLMCASHTPAAAQKHDELTALYRQVAQLYRAGKCGAATKIAQSALSVAEAKFGPDHPNVGTTLNNLAGLYQSQVPYVEAEPLYKRSLSIRETLSPDHPIVGQSLNNLAGLYKELGQTNDEAKLRARFKSRLNAIATIHAKQRVDEEETVAIAPYSNAKLKPVCAPTSDKNEPSKSTNNDAIVNAAALLTKTRPALPNRHLHVSSGKMVEASATGSFLIATQSPQSTGIVTQF